MSYNDTTYCASPNCNNKCDRKMNDKEKLFLKGHPWYPVSYAYFCGEPSSEQKPKEIQLETSTNQE